jgi:polyisoprenyl-phosphate glycosyltransferase
MRDSFPQVNILVPLFNEESGFPELAARLSALAERSDLSIEVIMVDDGSADRTPELMRDLCLQDDRFSAVFLSRNFGHQLALTAALSYVNATDAVLVIDGDLQDPPELLEEFFRYYREGYDVVYAIRKHRKETFIKRSAYALFYRILKRISYYDIPADVGDFSLISRRVVDHLNRMPEESRYIRGMRSWIGFRQIGVPYERQERHAGESKYTFSKLLRLAFNGIFNFSEFPIKSMMRLGIVTIVVSLGYLIYVVLKKYFFGFVPSGFTALLFVIILFGGVQLVGLGILGEYILRIFFQVKNRPLFIVRGSIRHREVHTEWDNKGNALRDESVHSTL